MKQSPSPLMIELSFTLAINHGYLRDNWSPPQGVGQQSQAANTGMGPAMRRLWRLILLGNYMTSWQI
jgi:hypothetical protein